MKFYTIPSYPYFKINKNGDIISMNYELDITPFINEDNQYVVRLIDNDGNINEEPLDSLVLETFVGKMNLKIIHNDRDLKHCSIENITYVANNIESINDDILINGILFKKIPDFDDVYISTNGTIYSTNRNKFLISDFDKGLYKRIKIVRRKYKVKTYFVHRLVYQSWVGEIPREKEINHINGKKYDNNLNNLELVTRLENIRHAETNGLRNKNKWSLEEIETICKCMEKNISARNIANYLNIDNERDIKKLITACKEIKNGLRFKDISSKYNVSNYNGEEHRLNSIRKLKESDVIEIIKMIQKGFRNYEIAKIFDVSAKCISDIRLGKRWKYISRELVKRYVFNDYRN